MLVLSALPLAVRINAQPEAFLPRFNNRPVRQVYSPLARRIFLANNVTKWVRENAIRRGREDNRLLSVRVKQIELPDVANTPVKLKTLAQFKRRGRRGFRLTAVYPSDFSPKPGTIPSCSSGALPGHAWGRGRRRARRRGGVWKESRHGEP